jgi:ribosome-binding factor A
MYRREKINHLLVEEVGKIFLKEMEFPQGVLVTIIKAETTEDAKEAKIYISCLPFEKAQQALEIINRNIYYIQSLLKKKLRMKPVPKIFFRIDSSLEKAGRVEELLGDVENTV